MIKRITKTSQVEKNLSSLHKATFVYNLHISKYVLNPFNEEYKDIIVFGYFCGKKKSNKATNI